VKQLIQGTKRCLPVRVQLLVAMAGTFALFSPSFPAYGQSVEPIELPRGQDEMLLPRPEQGAWHKQTQLIWDPASKQLERRTYELRDPLAELNLDFFWEPRRADRDEPGAISGEGVLTWRQAGSLRYGRETIVAQYRGALRNGRFEGKGTFVHRSTVRYDGDWARGAPDGEGHLMLPNGDVYTGGFKAGRIHGHGLYIAASGAVYEGSYANGMRDGAGLVSEANRFAYSGVWVRGSEDLSRRGPAPDDWPDVVPTQTKADEPSDLALAVSVGGMPQFCCAFDPPALSYTSKSYLDRLEIFPDAPEMLEAWRGKANVAVSDPRSFDWIRYGANEYSFWNYSSMHVRPVPLVLGLENHSRQKAKVVGAYLDVERSIVDGQPALQSLVLHPLNSPNIDFSVENYGWGLARDATLRFRFINAESAVRSDELEIHIGDIGGIGDFSFAGAMAELGAKENDVRTFSCAPSDCIAGIKASGIFGRLADYLSISGSELGTRVAGTLHYRWIDGEGNTHETNAPFETWVPITKFGSHAECEGSDYSNVAGLEPFSFRVENTASYRIPLPLSGDVSAGAISRWKIELQAPKSSTNRFRVVFQLADGRIVQSREIDLLYFKPQIYPDDIRPFEPRC
jgi:hypothetical protein